MKVYIVVGSDVRGEQLELLGVFSIKEGAIGRKALFDRDNKALGIRQFIYIVEREVE